ncbi:ABC transporter permease [Bauldia sp.]|uniref:ABC transporter permease n=1 Tax=Bauldia sp. TaxID=2575872 RepID=UPI003BAC6C71
MTAETAYSSRPEGSRLRDTLAAHAQVLAIAAFFITCCLLFTVITDHFLSTGNLLNLIRQAAPMLIVAIAMTLVITTGGIDLSVGSTLALTNAVAAIALQGGLPWPLVVVAILAMGALIGAFQGFFVAYQGIPSFIVTLAGLSALRGFALLLTQGYSIPIPPSTFTELGRGSLLGIPIPALIAVLVAIVGFVVLDWTRYGRQVIAIGSNAEAARRVGMPSKRVAASVFVLSGLAAALAGLIVAARLGSGSSNAAVGFELEVIAAVVLGGTSLMGGRGTMIGTVLGALTIAVIGNGLILAHVSPFFTQIVTGAIILLAIWLNTRIFSRLSTTRRPSVRGGA